MPLFDFGQANDALQKLSWILMQDTMSKRGDERAQEYLAKQGEQNMNLQLVDAALERARQAAVDKAASEAKEQAWQIDISKEPEYVRLKAIRSRRRMLDEPTDDIDAQIDALEKRAMPRYADLMTNFTTGQPELGALSELFPTTQQAALAEMAARLREGEKDRNLRFSELEFNKLKEANALTDKQQQAILAKIGRVSTFLTSRLGKKIAGYDKPGKPAPGTPATPPTTRMAAPTMNLYGVPLGGPQEVTVPGKPAKPGDVSAEEKASASGLPGRGGAGGIADEMIGKALKKISEVENKAILGEGLTDDDFTFLDEQYDIAMRAEAFDKARDWFENGRVITTNPQTGGTITKRYSSIDDAMEDAISEAMAKGGEIESRPTTGYDVDQKMSELSNGYYRFVNAPREVKAKFFSVFNALKNRVAQLGQDYKTSDYDVMMMILNDPEYDWMQKYVVQVGTPAKEPILRSKPKATIEDIRIR